ncbi:hypothetical protein [Roseovarius arcticus]|uniref:hypothetical protein n=1 Tax=Roseovarius arcticus TaxID=2547404 RepID=UPI00110FFDB9
MNNYNSKNTKWVSFVELAQRTELAHEDGHPPRLGGVDPNVELAHHVACIMAGTILCVKQFPRIASEELL